MTRGSTGKFKIYPSYFDDRYEIISTAGRGRESVVYKAKRFAPDVTMDIESPPLALKVLLGIERDPKSAIKRIKREALALLSCTSPSVIRMYDYVAREDSCYLSMEYAKYGDLRNIFENTKFDLSPHAILKLVQGILEGLSVVHNAGIIHRDLKPDNFLLTEDFQVKVCDFSVCLLKGERTDINYVNEIVGTFHYTAPECLHGHSYSCSSDLYSVAVSAYELLSGELPVVGKSINEMLTLKSSGEVKKLPENIKRHIPDIDNFFNIALNPDPEKRFKSASEMSEAISKLTKVGINKKNKNTYEVQTFSEDNLENTKDDKAKKHNDSKKQNTSVIKKITYLLTGLIIGLVSFSGYKYIHQIRGSEQNIQLHNNKFKTINNFAGFGVLHDLYSKGKDFKFTLSPYKENEVLFGLTHEGWEQVSVDISPIREKEPVQIKGEGLDLLLYPKSLKNDKISGEFENNITKETGSWSLVLFQANL